MLTPISNIAAAVLYLSAGGLLAKDLFAATKPVTSLRRFTSLGLAALAIILHAIALFTTITPTVILGFTEAASLIAWVIALLFVITSLGRPIENLGVLVLPLAAVAVLISGIWPGPPHTDGTESSLLGVHLAMSLLAYAFLALAMVQAVLLTMQENRLHQHHPDRLLQALPPIETMETLLFQLIGAGFALLSLTLISGGLFATEMFGKPLVFNHHIVLSLLAWSIFAILLAGRWRFGWRGQAAARWTIGGFIVLLLAYLGTRFVLEFIVQQ